jgi:hypothetical protein
MTKCRITVPAVREKKVSSNHIEKGASHKCGIVKEENSWDRRKADKLMSWIIQLAARLYPFSLF